MWVLIGQIREKTAITDNILFQKMETNYYKTNENKLPPALSSSWTHISMNHIFIKVCSILISNKYLLKETWITEKNLLSIQVFLGENKTFLFVCIISAVKLNKNWIKTVLFKTFEDESFGHNIY